MTLPAKVGAVPVALSLVHVRSGAAGEQVALLGDTAANALRAAVEEQLSTSKIYPESVGHSGAALQDDSDLCAC